MYLINHIAYMLCQSFPNVTPDIRYIFSKDQYHTIILHTDIYNFYFNNIKPTLNENLFKRKYIRSNK